MSYQHLHIHSEFSIQHSLLGLSDLVKTSKERGLKCVAVTDYTNIMCAYDLYTECKQEGLKPIIGCEFIVVKDKTKRDLQEKYEYIVLLAKNQEGFKNLITLNTIATMYFHKQARIDRESISKNSKGLVALSANLNGCIPQAVLNNTIDVELEFWENVFGEDLYLEIQPFEGEEQKRVNRYFIDLAPTRIIPTNNVHYLKKEEEKWFKYLLLNQAKANVRDRSVKINIFEYDKNELYLKNMDEMCDSFERTHSINIEKYLSNVDDVCNKIESYELDKTVKIPKYRRLENVGST